MSVVGTPLALKLAHSPVEPAAPISASGCSGPALNSVEA